MRNDASSGSESQTLTPSHAQSSRASGASPLSSRASGASRGICTLHPGIAAPEVSRGARGARGGTAHAENGSRRRALRTGVAVLSSHDPNSVFCGPAERSLRPALCSPWAGDRGQPRRRLPLRANPMARPSSTSLPARSEFYSRTERSGPFRVIAVQRPALRRWKAERPRHAKRPETIPHSLTPSLPHSLISTHLGRPSTLTPAPRATSIAWTTSA